MSNKIININNKKVSFKYQILEKYNAGIMLKGTEIKSIRNSQVNISEAHCIFINDELWVKNLHISEYQNSGYTTHDPIRKRKLLLNKNEINKIHSKVKTKGVTIIPVKLYINNKGKAKLEICTAKGKKLYDKRNDIKNKENKKKLDRIRKIK
tara:strand:+ start:1438 stop:1893 length:456 start_codon:yes stop_codon:yes gene_type:complete